MRTSASFPEWAERIGNWDFDMTMDAVYNWGDPVIGVHRTYVCDNIQQGHGLDEHPKLLQPQGGRTARPGRPGNGPEQTQGVVQ